MARLQKIFEVINSKLPSYNSAFTKLRGLAIPADPILRGKLRFAKKIGFPSPIWMPDNLSSSSKAATIVNDYLYLNDALDWAVIGAKVRISDHFIMEISDIAEDGIKLIFTETLPVNVDINSNVELYSVPIEVVGDYTTTPIVTPIVVKSDYRIYVGDGIIYDTFSYNVDSIIFSGTLLDGRYEYQLTLDGSIPDALTDGSTDQLYLRTYPAYESEKIIIPTISNVDSSINDIGPFLYDRVSGVFYTDVDVEELDNINLYTQEQLLITTVNDCGKNFAVLGKDIAADTFLFWDLLRGKLNWDDSDSTFKVTTDDEGVFHLHYKCVPTLEPGQITGWLAKVTPTINTRMSVELEPSSRQTVGPNSPQVWDLIGGSESTVNISFPSNALPIEHFHIIFKISPSVLNIQESTFNSPIEITTTTSHNLVTGGTVTISDHEINTAANGTWTITKVSDTKFTLNDSVGNGVGVATGTVLPLNSVINLGNFCINTQQVKYISHTTIAKVSGEVWASSPIFIKPYWFRLGYILANSDLASTLDAGLIAG
jgi:hypothetical protein